MPANRGLIPLVEAARSTEGDESDWLRGLCEAARPLIAHELGMVAVTYDAAKDDWIDLHGMNGVDVDPEILGCVFGPATPPLEEARQAVQFYRRRSVWTGQQVLSSVDLPGFHERAASVWRLGYPRADMFGLMCADSSHRGCLLAAFSPRPITLHPRTVSRWTRAAAHIATGARIRERLRVLQVSLLTESPETEAIFSPNGRSEHAVGPAAATEAQERLRLAVAQMERARDTGSVDSDEVLTLWNALLEGRWSLLDCFDRDGRRYWVAHANEPRVPNVRGLTLREQQVAACAALGQSNMLIAYELGISLTSVARHLRNARTKLGIDSRISLIQAVAQARTACAR